MRGDPGAELVDVLDETGATVGQATRREMRARRLPHRCCYILVFNRRGELFVHRRTATKDVFASHWDVAVGGVLGAGESFADGAARELAEELGVTVPLEPLFAIRYSDPSTIVHGMVFRAVHDGPFRLQADEIAHGEFHTLTAACAHATRAPFCPDGLAVLAEYRRRTGQG